MNTIYNHADSTGIRYYIGLEEQRFGKYYKDFADFFNGYKTKNEMLETVFDASRSVLEFSAPHNFSSFCYEKGIEIWHKAECFKEQSERIRDIWFLIVDELAEEDCMPKSEDEADISTIVSLAKIGLKRLEKNRY